MTKPNTFHGPVDDERYDWTRFYHGVSDVNNIEIDYFGFDFNEGSAIVIPRTPEGVQILTYDGPIHFIALSSGNQGSITDQHFVQENWNTGGCDLRASDYVPG